MVLCWDEDYIFTVMVQIGKPVIYCRKGYIFSTNVFLEHSFVKRTIFVLMFIINVQTIDTLFFIGLQCHRSSKYVPISLYVCVSFFFQCYNVVSSYNIWFMSNVSACFLKHERTEPNRVAGRISRRAFGT